MMFSYEHVVKRLLEPNLESFNPIVPTVTCPPGQRTPLPTFQCHHEHLQNALPIGSRGSMWIPLYTSSNGYLSHKGSRHKLRRSSLPSSAPTAGWQKVLWCPLCTSDDRQCQKRNCKCEDCYGQVCLQLSGLGFLPWIWSCAPRHHDAS